MFKIGPEDADSNATMMSVTDADNDPPSSSTDATSSGSQPPPPAQDADHFFLVVMCPEAGEILMPSFSTSGSHPLFPTITAKKDVSWKAVALEMLKMVRHAGHVA